MARIPGRLAKRDELGETACGVLPLMSLDIMILQ
jgi:hypothetical protein